MAGRVEFGYNPPSGDRGLEVLNDATYVRDLHEVCDVASQHFDTFWISDHFMRGDTFRMECWTHMTWMAARYPTQTVGTVVIGNSYRHPPLLAKMAASLQVFSHGRFILGYGAGSFGADARVLGYGPDGEGWSAKERGERYRESVEILDQLLRGAAEGRPRTTYRGTYYSAVDARMEPGCVQRPRVPFGLAATGPLGLRTVVKHAQMWIADDTTAGRDGEGPTPADTWAALEKASRKLDAALEQEGRDPATLPRLLLSGLSPLRTMESKARFDEVAGRAEELGFTDFVVHYPRESGAYATPADVLDEIAPANP